MARQEGAEALLRQFGERLRTLRVARGLSQEDLAERADMHRTYVGGIERGERNLALLNIWALARALHVPPARLFEDDARGEGADDNTLD